MGSRSRLGGLSSRAMRKSSSRALLVGIAIGCCALAFVPAPTAAIGEATQIEFAALAIAGIDDVRPLARGRLAWAMRMRTSMEVRLEPRRIDVNDPALFDAPFTYLAGNRAFPMPSENTIRNLRRYVELGGFLVVDDASEADAGFDASTRALLRRVFPENPLHAIPSTHTIYHSFYLVERPVGRVEGPAHVEGVELDGRLAVVYSRHDLGGAWSRDALGSYTFEVVPGGEEQRERAFRFGVNLAMYALCLDYKDDQVHVPFIMRRRPGQP